MIDGWPDRLPRTPPGDRGSAHKFSATRYQTVESIRNELERIGADDFTFHTGSGGGHTYPDGLPKNSANPDDPGVAVVWRDGESTRTVGFDAYTSLDDNLRGLYLWIAETRKSGDRPATAPGDTFAAAELPPADGESADGERDPLAGVDPYEWLGVTESAPEAVIEAALRQAKKQNHPDSGGSAFEWRRVQAVEEAVLDG